MAGRLKREEMDSGAAGAEEADHHALDDELVGGQKVGVAGILGAEEGTSLFEEVALQRRFAVDERGDDVAGAGVAGGEEDDVAVENTRVDHGVAADAEREKAGVGADAEGRGVDGDVAVGLLFGRSRQAGGNRAEERNLRQSAAPRVRRREETTGDTIEAAQGAFGGERVDVALDPERTGETEVGLDFAQRRGDAVLAVVGVDEIEDLLLAVGKWLAHVFT